MLKVLTFFILISSSFAYPEELLATYNESAITKSVTDIILNFYVGKSSTLDVFYSADQDEDLVSVHSFINEILYNINIEIAVQVDDYNTTKTVGRRYTSNIFFITSYNSFRKIFDRITPWSFDHQGHYLIVFTITDPDIYWSMRQMFSDLWAEYIVNVAVLWMPPENDNEALLFTYFPYNRFYCGSIVPVILNQFIDDSWINERNFFPKKMINLHGCVLRVATFSNPPFVILPKVKSKKREKGQFKIDGIDAMLLYVVAKRMNFTPELDIVDDAWGIVAVRENKIISTGNHKGSLELK
jgi:hypothetical protein